MTKPQQEIATNISIISARQPRSKWTSSQYRAITTLWSFAGKYGIPSNHREFDRWIEKVTGQSEHVIQKVRSRIGVVKMKSPKKNMRGSYNRQSSLELNHCLKDLPIIAGKEVKPFVAEKAEYVQKADNDQKSSGSVKSYRIIKTEKDLVMRVSKAWIFNVLSRFFVVLSIVFAVFIGYYLAKNS